MKLAIIGAGGFARELAWLIRDIAEIDKACGNPVELLGFLSSTQGEYDSEVLGDFSWLEKNECDALAMGIGTPPKRLEIARELKQRFPALKWPALIHPSVRYDLDSCTFGEGATICAGNIFTVGVNVGAFALVNLSCTVGHETEIGDGSVINPLCAISGGVKIGTSSLVGTHSAILQYVTVGDNATVGSGAMVNKNVAANTIVVGVPAKPHG